MPKSLAKKQQVAAIDLFCGAGGLTHGLVKAGIPVVAGIDLDPNCRFPFEANNKSNFILRNVADVTSSDLLAKYPKDTARVMVGCAPCQPFSRYSQTQDRLGDQKWGLLEHFARLVEGVRPAVVSMENVPELARHEVFKSFLQRLVASGYHVSHSNVFCPDYGIPQHRTRLVLFASLLGQVDLISPTHSPKRAAPGSIRPSREASRRAPPASIASLAATRPA